MFSAMLERDKVSYIAMISGYVQCGDLESALSLFELDPFKRTPARTALITGYMKVGNYVEMAEKMFEEVSIKSSATWIAMLTGYVENSRPEDALKIFKKMHVEKRGWPDTTDLG